MPCCACAWKPSGPEQKSKHPHIKKNKSSIHYANPNLAADAYLSPEVKHDPAIYPSKKVIDTLFTVEDLPAKIARLSTRLWTKLKTNT